MDQFQFEFTFALAKQRKRGPQHHPTLSGFHLSIESWQTLELVRCPNGPQGW